MLNITINRIFIPNPVNSVTACPMSVVPDFTLDIKKDKYKNSDANSQTGHIEYRITPLTVEYP